MNNEQLKMIIRIAESHIKRGTATWVTGHKGALIGMMNDVKMSITEGVNPGFDENSFYITLETKKYDCSTSRCVRKDVSEEHYSWVFDLVKCIRENHLIDSADAVIKDMERGMVYSRKI